MSRLSNGVIYGREAADRSLAAARALIQQRNDLAKAVRFISEQATCAPVAQLLIPANPFGQE